MIQTIVWQRLEPASRSDDFDTALQARVHDPLWLLGRQWQFGELLGEDAGSPLSARLETVSTPLSRWQPGPDGTPGPYDPIAEPLEMLVEREPPGPPVLRDRAEAGRVLSRFLRDAGADPAVDLFVTAFSLADAPAAEGPTDPARERLLAVLGSRVPDGVAAADAIRAGQLPSGLGASASAAASAFLAWFDAQAPGPATDSWVTSRLEYRFAASAYTESGEVVLQSPEYRGGTLDWYDVSVAPGTLGATAPATPTDHDVRTVLVAPVRFAGMPADRFWEFEDADVSMPSVEVAPDDLGHLVLVEFATVFGNDWFVLPTAVPYGSLSRVVSLVVRDTFEEDLMVGPTAATTRATAPWRAFTLSGDASGSLLVPPVVPQVLEGDALEEVLYVRDEMANLAWAVERQVEGADGRARDRQAEYVRRVVPDKAPPPSVAELAYLLQTTVPDYWIPFLPVHDSAERRGVRLERGAMLDPTDDTPIPPIGRLLQPAAQQLVLFEEEVPRQGVRVRRIAAMCRWLDGRRRTWTGRRVSAGRGEGSSGLAFDLARQAHGG